MDKYSFSNVRIFNTDESSLSTVPYKIAKVVSAKNQKLVGKAASAERGQTISLVCCMSAADNYILPAVIFPLEKEENLS